MLRNIMMLGAWAAALAPMSSAHAADEIPFSIGSNAYGYFECRGPYFRNSGCAGLDATTFEHPQLFYRADNNFLSPFHDKWVCRKFEHAGCDEVPTARLEFCLENPQVILQYDAHKNVITANQPDESCAGVAPITRSVLGFGGEDDGTRQDVDAFVFAGKSREQVEVEVDIDGVSGGINGAVTLRLVDPPNNVLAEKKGNLPLRLKATLNGQVQVQVIRDASPKAFRGFYTVELIPSGAMDDRQLVPTESVEQ